MIDKEQRQIELQWIDEYKIEDTNEAIALKAVELLKPALMDNPWSRETEKILNILLDKLNKIETNELVMQRSITYVKAYDALLKFSSKDYIEYMARNFDEWASEIKEGIVERNTEYIANGQTYISGIELTIYSELELKK